MESEPAEEYEFTLPPILVVDVETTGTNPQRHSIIELGAVWLTGQEHPEEFEMECSMWEGAEYNPEVEAINGRTDASCINPILLTESELIREFVEFLDKDFDFILAGMNPSFDRRFLLAAAERAGLGRLPIPHRTLDLHSLALADAIVSKSRVPKRGLYTDRIYEHLRLEAEPKPHRALTGARKEAEAFETLLDL